MGEVLLKIAKLFPVICFHMQNVKGFWGSIHSHYSVHYNLKNKTKKQTKQPDFSCVALKMVKTWTSKCCPDCSTSIRRVILASITTGRQWLQQLCVKFFEQRCLFAKPSSVYYFFFFFHWGPPLPSYDLLKIIIIICLSKSYLPIRHICGVSLSQSLKTL